MRLRSCLALTLLGAPLAANADVTFYSNNFESGVGSGWGSAAATTYLAPFSTYLGRYSGNQGVLLTLARPGTPALQPGQSIEYHLTFDFYAIDTWDGDDPAHGPDYFYVSSNGNVVFAQTFANQHEYQSFHGPTVGPVSLGYAPGLDSIYRDIDVTLNPGPAGNIAISLYALGLQGMSDESWGVDNLRVSYRVVPAPASAGVLALGGMLASRRRR